MRAGDAVDEHPGDERPERSEPGVDRSPVERSPAERRLRAVLAAVVLVTFWPALLGAYVADDVRLLANNPALRTGDLAELVTAPMFGAQHGYWRPLTMLALYCGDALGGAFGVHTIALALHVLNTWAAHDLARRLLPPAGAAWAAVVFAVHPVQVESVAWCSAVNDPLWVAFALQAMLAAARWHEGGRRGVPWLAGAAALAALLAKEPGAAAIPLAAGTAWALRLRDGARGWGAWRLGVPLAAAAALWLVARAVVQREPVGQFVVSPAVDPFEGASAWRVAQLLAAQAWLLVWPWPTHCVRSLEPWGAWDWRALAAAGALVIASAAVLLAPLRAALRLAALLVVLPLLPVVAYSPVIGTYPIADRYLYACAAGFGIALSALLRADRWGHARWLLPAVLAVTSFVATWNWQDAERLTRHSLACAPADPMVMVMAGDLARERGFQHDPFATGEATELYRRALAVIAASPPSEQLRSSERKATLGLAWCALLRHRDGAGTADETIAAFRAAVDLAPKDPMTWLGLGAAEMELRRPESAEAAFREALRLDPGNRAAAAGIERARARTPR